MKQPSAIEVLAFIAQTSITIGFAETLIAGSVEGQETRWNLLRGWIESDPSRRRYTVQSPASIIGSLCAERSIPLAAVRMFEQGRALEARAIKAIETIQQLYRERAGIAQGAIND